MAASDANPMPGQAKRFQRVRAPVQPTAPQSGISSPLGWTVHIQRSSQAAPQKPT